MAGAQGLLYPTSSSVVATAPRQGLDSELDTWGRAAPESELEHLEASSHEEKALLRLPPYQASALAAALCSCLMQGSLTR